MRQQTRAEIHTQRRSDRKVAKRAQSRRFVRELWDISAIFAWIIVILVILALIGR